MSKQCQAPGCDRPAYGPNGIWCRGHADAVPRRTKDALHGARIRNETNRHRQIISAANDQLRNERPGEPET